jgi:5-methylthioadenosine/S-adenosylhomocysteine deaminase
MYVGLDVHKRVCYGTLTDENGQVIKRGKFSNDEDGLKSFMQGVDEAQVAMEAGLGTDQAPGSTGHGTFIQMKVAALLNKTRHRDPTVLPAWKMLRLATVEGATAIGLGDKVGSLEAGKKADVVIFDLKTPHMTPILTRPVRNVAPNIVYGARSDEVETVIVNGSVVVEDRRCTTLDEERVMAEAQRAAEELTALAEDDYMAAGSHLAEAARKGLL